jgi:hypothetical protein
MAIQQDDAAGIDSFFFQYQSEAHLQIPKLYYQDGKISKIEQTDQNRMQKQKLRGKPT